MSVVIINSDVVYSYWTVGASIVVVYDWILTLGQEVELIRIRYIGISYSVGSANMPRFSLTDARCSVAYYASNGTTVVVPAMLGVIMIARLYAMYQRSRIVLTILVIVFLAVNIACEVIVAVGLKGTRAIGEELILSGIYLCNYGYGGDIQLLFSMVWILNTIWEILALCFSVWIAVKHFRGLRRLGPWTGSTVRDCLRGLIKSHALYFAGAVHTSFACVSSLQLYPKPSNSYSIGAQILYGALQILLVVQMFLLGPSLILSVREYHVELMAGSDTETGMSSIVFQGRHVHIPTSSTV
ncbi:hypothetical protein BDR04DRAFT_1115004 [Suillus decipiens]|nr:hypothetical protein BDR04DRAFT_1115004 [Suillus decipiens]